MSERDDYWTESGDDPPPQLKQQIIVTEEVGLVPEAMPDSNALMRLTAMLFSEQGWNTYALIDPSLVVGLTTDLENSGAFYRCLHRNPDDGNAGTAYPWLVELRPESAIFRKLCTAGQPRGWWEDEVGIFMRTTLSADRLWAHLRKFHRIPDEHGNWFLLRYWDPELLLGLTRIALPALTGLVLPEVQVIARWADHVAILHTAVIPARLPIHLNPGDKARIGAIRTGRRIRGIGAQLRSGFTPELEQTSDPELWLQISEVLDVADDIGLIGGEVRAKFVVMSVVTVPGMHLDKAISSFLRRTAQPDQRFRELDDVIRRRVGQALKEGGS